MEERSLKRNYAFDNIKAIMIILMVFGHLIEEYGYDGVSGMIWVFIYSFHMPAFVFISGYFSKNTDKGISNAVSTLLIPYLIFDVIFTLFRNDFRITSVDIFEPNYAYWYIFSLFVWRIAIKPLSKIKHLFEISVAIALTCGYHSSINHYLSSSRIIVFFPFFVLGYYFTEKDIDSIKKNSKFVFAFVAAVAGFITIALKSIDMIPARMYTFDSSYSAHGLEFGTGFVYRSIMLIVAFMFILAFINLVPNKKCILSTIGSRTITIYLFSSFITKAFAVIMKRFNAMPSNPLIQVAISICMTLVVLAITGNKWIYSTYNKTFTKIGSFFTTKE